MRRWSCLALVCSACFSKPAFHDGDGGVGDDASQPNNVMFVTSAMRAPGGLGSGADALCATLAATAGLPANTYVAWLSTSTQSAFDKIFATGARGWVRQDGAPIADSLSDLASGKHFYPPRLDEYGADVAGDQLAIATGTKKDGTLSANCDNFANLNAQIGYGFADGADRIWTAAAVQGCSSPMRFYCLGVDHATPATLSPDPTHRLAFVSTTVARADATRVVMDGMCNSDAMAAGLPGMFLAALPGVGSSIKTRFANGTVWARLDGVVVLDASMTDLQAPITGAAGQLQDQDVFGGVDSFTNNAVASETCSGWTSNAGALSARTGYAFRSLTKLALDGGGMTCPNATARVYCLQQ